MAARTTSAVHNPTNFASKVYEFGSSEFIACVLSHDDGETTYYIRNGDDARALAKVLRAAAADLKFAADRVFPRAEKEVTK